MEGARGDLVESVRRELKGAGDPARATGQQAYLKSAMPLRGISAPQLKAVLRPILSDPAYLVAGRDEWESTVRTLWDGAGFREERYAALAVARHRSYRQWATEPSAMPLYRHLVESGAWWDLVDEVAAHLVGPIVRAHHQTEAATMRSWATADNLWVRRAAILSQLSSGQHTDRELLLDCIIPNLTDRDPFIRKAVGWSLRQYARSGTPAADWVRETVDQLGSRLSPLSRRQALKHLG